MRQVAVGFCYKKDTTWHSPFWKRALKWEVCTAAVLVFQETWGSVCVKGPSWRAWFEDPNSWFLRSQKSDLWQFKCGLPLLLPDFPQSGGTPKPESWVMILQVGGGPGGGRRVWWWAPVSFKMLLSLQPPLLYLPLESHPRIFLGFLE